MNNTIAKIGAAIATGTVLLFAIFMIIDFPTGSYIVCMFLAMGYIMMAAGFHTESPSERRTAATTGLAFAVVYAMLILLVYFAQVTSVRLEDLNEQATHILDFQRGGLLFNYDLLGYGMMAISTFFIGISIKVNCKSDKYLKYLMMIHGVFFICCFIMPMTGMFTSMADGDVGNAGTIALLGWCAYFLPISVLSYKHFQ